MDNKSCFFIGNSRVLNDVSESLAEAVEKHICEYGVTDFIIGNYGEFDRIVQVVLKETKKKHDNISLYLLTPYALDRKEKSPESFDGTFYPEGMENCLKRFAIVKANRLMISNSDYLITYCRHIGKTRDFVEYAKKQEKKGLIKITFL